MENKYTLQDAKDEVSKKYGYLDWEDMYAQDHRPLSFHVDEIANLWASKATEELRKENASFKLQLNISLTSEAVAKEEIERLKESNKELVEALKEATKYAPWNVDQHAQKLIQKSES